MAWIKPKKIRQKNTYWRVRFQQSCTPTACNITKKKKPLKGTSQTACQNSTKTVFTEPLLSLISLTIIPFYKKELLDITKEELNIFWESVFKINLTTELKKMIYIYFKSGFCRGSWCKHIWKPHRKHFFYV